MDKMRVILQFIVLITLLFLIIAGLTVNNKHTMAGKVTDIDGNIYRTIIIGNQEWMRENLKTTTFNNGIDITHLSDSDWTRTNSPAFSWYNNEEKNYETFGALYNWYTVESGKLCPSGWQVPSDEEWSKLIEFAGGEEIAGGKLKIIDTNYWDIIDKENTNKLNFSALPGGYRYGHYWSSAEYMDKGINGYWWTSTDFTHTHAWSRTIHFVNPRVYRSYFEKNDGFSVRCIKNH